MIGGNRAASHLLCQSPVNVFFIPLINMLKTFNHCTVRQLGKPFNTLIYIVDILEVAGPGKIPPTESGNGKRGSNVMP